MMEIIKQVWAALNKLNKKCKALVVIGKACMEQLGNHLKSIAHSKEDIRTLGENCDNMFKSHVEIIGKIKTLGSERKRGVTFGYNNDDDSGHGEDIQEMKRDVDKLKTFMNENLCGNDEGDNITKRGLLLDQSRGGGKYP